MHGNDSIDCPLALGTRRCSSSGLIVPETVSHPQSKWLCLYFIYYSPKSPKSGFFPCFKPESSNSSKSNVIKRPKTFGKGEQNAILGFFPLESVPQLLRYLCEKLSFLKTFLSFDPQMGRPKTSHPPRHPQKSVKSPPPPTTPANRPKRVLPPMTPVRNRIAKLS